MFSPPSPTPFWLSPLWASCGLTPVLCHTGHQRLGTTCSLSVPLDKVVNSLTGSFGINTHCNHHLARIRGPPPPKTCEKPPLFLVSQKTEPRSSPSWLPWCGLDAGQVVFGILPFVQTRRHGILLGTPSSRSGAL